MKIFRFDEETAIPISEYASLFSIAPLTGPASSVRVQVLFLPANGHIGRHPTDAPQLVAVMSGAGWAAGADRRRRDLKPGYGAFFEAAEEHEAGTAQGMTAICVEGNFELWALSVTREIRVADYDPMWPQWFEQVRAYVWPAVAAVASRIDHVGSTAVPGLAAKPIIDMDVVVSSNEGVAPAVDALRSIGYRWRGELGVTGRQAFARPKELDLPAHNLYVVVDGNKAHLDHTLLRDLLRQDADARERYASLKRQNVEVAEGDMDTYVAAKAPLVAELLTRARSERGLPPADYWDP